MARSNVVEFLCVACTSEREKTSEYTQTANAESTFYCLQRNPTDTGAAARTLSINFISDTEPIEQ